MTRTNINSLVLTYCTLGCLGGAGLGFLSLGLPGLALGLVGGTFLAYVLRNAATQINES